MDSDVVLLSKDTISGITVTDATNGKFSFTLSKEETATLNGTYYHEVETEDGNGFITTEITGSVYVTIGAVNQSYVSVAYADSYFDGVLFPEPWFTTPDETKQKALNLATKRIDSLPIRGVKVSDTQPFQFPRALYSERGLVYESEVSDAVLNAVCEEALALLKGGSEADKRAQLQRQGVTSFSLGGLSESYSGAYTGNKLLSVTATQLLSKYTGGGRAIM
jgi:hypothetical protein